MSKELILGSSGFVGSEFLKHHTRKFHTPSSSQVDTTNRESLRFFLSKNLDIRLIINFIGYTNTKLAQLQKGDKESPSWKINVEGTKNIIKACEEFGIYLIHISTDNVFYEKMGPSDESNVPRNNGSIDWYGHTKLKAEEEIAKSKINSAILRISYPFSGSTNSKDYIVKIVKAIERRYSLFDDQVFTPTYLPEAFNVLNKLIETKTSGIFHSACTGLTTPYEIGKYVKNLLELPWEVKSGSLKDFEKANGKNTIAYEGGLKTEDTKKNLGLRFSTWQEALGKESQNYKGHLPDILD